MDFSILIAVPTLNSSKELPSLIKSLDMQTFTNWEVLFIDEYGREITQELYPITELPAADRYYTFLPDLTGLKIGEARSEESLRRFYLDGINKFGEKLEKDFNDLSISNNSNNCRVLNSEKYPLSTNIFLEEKKQFESLREKFALEPYVLKGYCD